MQNYRLFYNTEIMLRKQLKYPPFCDIIMIGISSVSEQEVEKASKKIYELINKENNISNPPDRSIAQNQTKL